MFMSNDRDKNINKIETLIGEGCSITGSLKGENLLKLNGYLEGNIIWQDDVLIGTTGYCKGDLICKNAYINGKIEGNVTCEGILTIEDTGQVMGDISIRNIIVKEGGLLDGKCCIIK
ncbi:polymer-forming cytoskeletal protein [uncultured Clostridium sp.]|uniref:bactofilin family protein n=1 Tax=uncultured Clostridium sp. TaxID=59620 RepID=UPI0028E79985|nr:polymer-forming cytoskeletal protein [uncultured Clostridium sp.]